MSIAYDGNNTYYIDSLGYYHLQSLVPYSNYNYNVEIVSPLLPSVGSDIVEPEVTLADFNKWCPMFEEKIVDEDHFMYGLWSVLIDIGREAVNYELCGTDKRFKQAVSYYVAHFLTVHLRELKDEERKYSLDPHNKEAEMSIEEKKINMADNSYGNYRSTPFGSLFWTVYGQSSKWNIGYQAL